MNSINSHLESSCTSNGSYSPFRPAIGTEPKINRRISGFKKDTSITTAFDLFKSRPKAETTE